MCVGTRCNAEFGVSSSWGDGVITFALCLSLSLTLLLFLSHWTVIYAGCSFTLDRLHLMSHLHFTGKNMCPLTQPLMCFKDLETRAPQLQDHFINNWKKLTLNIGYMWKTEVFLFLFYWHFKLLFAIPSSNLMRFWCLYGLHILTYWLKSLIFLWFTPKLYKNKGKPVTIIKTVWSSRITFTMFCFPSWFNKSSKG